MSARSGLSGQLGFVPETTYGTAVSVNRFAEFNNAALQEKKTVAQGAGLAAGRRLMHSGRRVVTTRQVTGKVNFDVVNRGLGSIFQTLFGTSVTPVKQGATLAYIQTHTLADLTGKSLSMQLGVPSADGAVQSYSARGVKITDATFTGTAADILTCEIGLDGMDLTAPTDAGAVALATASYTTGIRPFVGTDATILITPLGGGGAFTMQGGTKWTAKFTRGMNPNRFYIGNGIYKAEPIENAYQQVTGAFSADYMLGTGAQVPLDQLYENDTQFSAVITYQGLNIATGFYDTLVFTFPACYFDQDDPTVANPDVVNSDYSWTCLTNDAGAMPSLVITSLDATL